MKTPHDNKKHPYLRSGFWVNNKYWDTEMYSNKTKQDLEPFYKKEVKNFISKGHDVRET